MTATRGILLREDQTRLRRLCTPRRLASRCWYIHMHVHAQTCMHRYACIDIMEPVHSQTARIEMLARELKYE